MAQRAYQNVKFKTVDGVYLRGRLYPAARRGPAVVMSPGVGEMFESIGVSQITLTDYVNSITSHWNNGHQAFQRSSKKLVSLR